MKTTKKLSEEAPQKDEQRNPRLRWKCSANVDLALVEFTVDHGLLRDFDDAWQSLHYNSRAEALRDAMRLWIKANKSRPT